MLVIFLKRNGIHYNTMKNAAGILMNILDSCKSVWKNEKVRSLPLKNHIN